MNIVRQITFSGPSPAVDWFKIIFRYLSQFLGIILAISYWTWVFNCSSATGIMRPLDFSSKTSNVTSNVGLVVKNNQLSVWYMRTFLVPFAAIFLNNLLRYLESLKCGFIKKDNIFLKKLQFPAALTHTLSKFFASASGLMHNDFYNCVVATTYVKWCQENNKKDLSLQTATITHNSNIVDRAYITMMNTSYYISNNFSLFKFFNKLRIVLSDKIEAKVSMPRSTRIVISLEQFRKWDRWLVFSAANIGNSNCTIIYF